LPPPPPPPPTTNQKGGGGGGEKKEKKKNIPHPFKKVFTKNYSLLSKMSEVYHHHHHQVYLSRKTIYSNNNSCQNKINTKKEFASSMIDLCPIREERKKEDSMPQ